MLAVEGDQGHVGGRIACGSFQKQILIECEGRIELHHLMKMGCSTAAALGTQWNSERVRSKKL